MKFEITKSDSFEFVLEEEEDVVILSLYSETKDDWYTILSVDKKGDVTYYPTFVEDAGLNPAD
jgi:hypothetical protein